MAQPPPTAIRYLVLVAAIALLGLAVCTKTEKANQPSPQQAAPAPAPETLPSPDPVSTEAADAGLSPEATQNVAAPQQAPNPPTNTVDKGSSKDNGNVKKPPPKLFPATKSGGMF